MQAAQMDFVNFCTRHAAQSVFRYLSSSKSSDGNIGSFAIVGRLILAMMRCVSGLRLDPVCSYALSASGVSVQLCSWTLS
jgi:hypothetical protein